MTVGAIDERERYLNACIEKRGVWPFEDCPQDDPLVAMRIAVTSSHPGWRYLVAFDRESPERPTEAEAAMLRSFLDEYKDHWYNPSFLASLDRYPLDVDGGANGVIFHKHGTGDWRYRRQSWRDGAVFVPEWPNWRESQRARGIDVPGPLTLAQVMDRIYTFGDDKPIQHWADWTAARPDVFAPAIAGATEVLGEEG